MNKKLLIVSLFAILMLLVPITSVVGVSDVSLNRKIEKIEDNKTITETYDNEDCGCQVVRNQHLVILERLLNRVKIYTNVISILSNNSPVVKEKCNEILNILNMDKICEILFEIMSSYVEKMEEFLETLYILLGETDLAQRILFILGEFLFMPVYPLGFLYELLGCREYP